MIVSSGFIWSRTETSGSFLLPRIITVRMAIIMHLFTKQTVHFFKKVAVSLSCILVNTSPLKQAGLWIGNSNYYMNSCPKSPVSK